MSDVKKLLDLPDCPLVVAFRAIEDILRSDPVLLRVVKTWRTLSGDPGDKQNPASDDLPLVGMCLVPQPDTRDTESTQQVNAAIAIELFTEGTCQDDTVNLWYSGIVPALYLGKPYQGESIEEKLRCSLLSESVRSFYVTRPAFMRYLPSDSKPNDPMASLGYGSGLVTFDFVRQR